MAILWEKVRRSRENKRKGHSLKECQLTPDDYHERDVARVAKFHVNGKKYADATIKAIDRVSRFWQRYIHLLLGTLL
jgi:hypothetical protein